MTDQVKPAIPYALFDNNSVAAPVNSNSVTLPRSVLVMNWVYRFASAPSSASIRLQASMDGTYWFDIDEGTDVNGEARELSNPIIYPYLRSQKTSQSGGGALTVEVIVL
jgi:hypothetical protein